MKIVDFGISHLVDSTRRLTEADKIVGTVGYMAPEQLQNEPIDCRTDIYAVGVLLFEMLTAELPYNASSTEALFRKQLIEPPEPLSKRRPDILPGSNVDIIVQKALAKSPEHRYQTAADLLLALEYALADAHGGTSPPRL